MEIRIIKATTTNSLYSYKNNLTKKSFNKIDLIDRYNEILNPEYSIRKIKSATVKLGVKEIEFYNMYDIINNQKPISSDYLKLLYFQNSFYNLIYKLELEFKFIDSAREEIVKYYSKECIRKNNEFGYNFGGYGSFVGRSIYATDEFVSYIKKLIRKKQKNKKQLSEIEYFFYSVYADYSNLDSYMRSQIFDIDICWRVEDRICKNYYFLDLLINNLKFVYQKRIATDYSISDITEDEKNFMLFVYEFEFFFFKQVLNFNSVEELDTISKIDRAFELTLNSLKYILNIDICSAFLLNKDGLKENIDNPLLQYVLFTYYKLVDGLAGNHYTYVIYGMMIKENSNILISSTLFNVDKLNQMVDGIIYLNRNINFSCSYHGIKPLPLQFSTRYTGYVEDFHSRF